MGKKKEGRILDCRKVGSRMSSLSISPNKHNPAMAMVAAHEGTKPDVGDYLLLTHHDEGGLALYHVLEADHCYNVDPANMWIAHAVFVPYSSTKKKFRKRVTKALAEFYDKTN